MALVQAVGKPDGASTFGDLVVAYCRVIYSFFTESCTRGIVVFDIYRTKSIKT